MDLNDLRYFALIVEHGGFTAAERVSHIPKSKLSRRVAALENQLGARLLHRSTRKLSLTEAGRVFYEHVAVMLVEAESAEQAVANLASEPVGTVRLSCPSAITQFLMAHLVAEFMQLYPRLRVELESSDRIVCLVDERIDVVVRTSPGGLDDSGLTARRVSSGRLVLVASPDFAKAHPQIDPSTGRIDLDTIGALHNGPEQIWPLCSDDGREQHLAVNPRFLCSDFVNQFQAATGGVGVALLPERIAAIGIDQGSLVRVAPALHTVEQEIFVVFVTCRGLLPSVRAMIDFLVERMPAALAYK